MKTQIVFIIGMMGSGKSTIGELLAEKNKLFFLDLDRELEKVTDMSINEMFNYYGYNRFRLMESALFKECSKLKQFVISTGGGIVENKNNRSILMNVGQCIFLDCELKELINRIQNKTTKRPLIQDNMKFVGFLFIVSQ